VVDCFFKASAKQSMVGLLALAICVTTMFLFGVHEATKDTTAPLGKSSASFGQIIDSSMMTPWYGKKGRRDMVLLVEDRKGPDSNSPLYAHDNVLFWNSLSSELHRLIGRVSQTSENEVLEISSCLTCARINGSIWVSAVSLVDGSSVAALVKRHANGSANVWNVNMQFEQSKWTTIDIGVPVGCRDSRLRKFAANLRPIVESFSHAARLRLVVTRYPCDQNNQSAATEHELEVLSGLQERMVKTGVLGPCVLFIEMEPPFSRAAAINALNHMDTDSAALLLVLDVDMYLKESFMWNAIAFVCPNVSSYFPIVWSSFDPDAVALVAEFYQEELPMFSEHRGMWRRSGFGMYAIARSDARNIVIDASAYSGWGGEDVDFYSRVRSSSIHAIRKKELGLTHEWHSKDCADKRFVSRAQLSSCVSMLSSLGGSALSQSLKMFYSKDPTLRATLLKSPS